MKVSNCNITVMVLDMDRAIDFYTNTLGLTLKQRYDNHYAEIDAPGLSIGLHPTDQANFGNNISIGLGVTEFDASVEELKGKGVDVQVNQDGWIRLGSFKDPDGNDLYLAELKS